MRNRQQLYIYKDCEEWSVFFPLENSICKPLHIQVVSGSVEASHTFLIPHIWYHGRFYGKKARVVQVRGVTFILMAVSVSSRWTMVAPQKSRLEYHLFPKGIFLAHNLKFSSFFSLHNMTIGLPLTLRFVAIWLHSTIYLLLTWQPGLSYLTSKSSLICISCNIRVQMADPRDSFHWKALESSGSDLGAIVH